MIHIRRLPGRYGSAAFLGFALGLVIFIYTSKVLWELPLPVTMSHFDMHLAGWMSIRLNTIVPEFFPDIARRYGHYLAALPAGTPAWHLMWRFDAPFLLSLIAATWIIWIVGRGQPDTRIIAGRKLWEGRTAHQELRDRSEADCAISGEGLKLHPRFPWCLSRDRETRHFLVLGSIGGGKTVIIVSLLKAAIARGDRAIVYDNKGDFTSGMDAPFVLLTPWDKRSHAWDIARDCTTQPAARDLAARLVPESQDPMWSNAARLILTCLIQHLQQSFPKTWSWRDLYLAICLPQEKLAEIVDMYAPEERATKTEGRTIDGVLINFATYMGIVADLAAAWGDAAPDRRFSLIDWIKDPNPKKKVVIMQGSGAYEVLMKSYIQSIVSLLSGYINSPKVVESKTRRLWLFLDEFPQLGKIQGFASILEVGRSKGVCVALGAQDIGQIEEIYGQYVAKTWGSLIGTQIVVRVNSGTTAQFLAKEVIGYATIEKTTIHEGKPQPATTQQQLVLEPSDISDYLGPTKHGVRAVLLGFGDAFILEWPYTSSPKLREASIEAPWVKGGIKSNESLPPFPTAGAPTMTTTMAQPLTIIPAPAGIPRLKLRTPSADEMLEMAGTGTDIMQAGEAISDMQANAEVQTWGAV